MPGSGHGHVYRAAGGYRATCGGPGPCWVCSDELSRFVASQPERDAARRQFEAELQAQFDRAKERM